MAASQCLREEGQVCSWLLTENGGLCRQIAVLPSHGEVGGGQAYWLLSSPASPELPWRYGIRH
jgi:hypothetical protein